MSEKHARMRRLTENVVPMSFASTAVASSGGSGSSLTWLWILIGAVALGSVIVLVLVGLRSGRYFGRLFGRDSVVVGGWLSRAIDAYERGLALHQAISAAQRPDAPTAEDGGARWSDIQRRADDLAGELEELRKAAPDVGDRTRAADALGFLQSLRSAMDGQKDAGAADVGREEIRTRLDAFELSLRRLRSPEQHLW